MTDEITNPERGRKDSKGVDKVAKSSRVKPVLIEGKDLGTDPNNERPHFTVELVGDQVGQAMTQIVEEAQYWINKGRHIMPFSLL